MGDDRRRYKPGANKRPRKWHRGRGQDALWAAAVQRLDQARAAVDPTILRQACRDYWLQPQVPVYELAERINCKAWEVATLVGPWRVGRRCVRCGVQARVEYSDRRQLYTPDGAFRPWWCGPCWEVERGVSAQNS